MTAPIRSIPVSNPDEPIAVITGHESMVEAFRIAKDLRNLSNQFCDDAGDFTDGQTDKVLGPTGTKNLGQVTIDEFMKMFAVKFVMVRDLDAEACMKDVWEGRQSSHVRRDTKRLSKALVERAKPIIFSENGKRGGLARMKIPREVRVKLARRAAVIRWRRQRATEKLAKTQEGVSV